MANVDKELPDIIVEAVDLTPYGVEYRYPGDYPDVTAEDADKALAIARNVRHEIRNRLPEFTLKD